MSKAPLERAAEDTSARMRVLMLDLGAIVPYYTAHLCASLVAINDVSVETVSITYHHDPGCFSRVGVRNSPGFLDFAWRSPAPLRRGLKGIEYVANLAGQLARAIRNQPDVIHVQFLPFVKWGVPFERWFLRAASALGIRIVYTAHNVLPQNTGDRHRSVYARIYRLADHLICHDELAAERLRSEFSIPLQRISVIPHGPLFEQGRARDPRQVRAKLGLEPDSCIFLWHGILRPYKGVSFLLKAWRAVCTADQQSTLAIVGGGDSDLTRAVGQEIADLGIGGRVHANLRFVPLEDLEDYFDVADVLVYPYSEITTSGALMTGVVKGKAVVATSLAPFRRVLIDGKTALLTQYGDTTALADQLLRLARDPGLRALLGNNLRERQRLLPGWPEIARRTHDCYSEVSRIQTENILPTFETAGARKP